MIGGLPLHNQGIANTILQDILDNPPDAPVLVYFDPDVDGLISGRFLVEFLQQHDIPYTTYINPNRAHGFLLDPATVAGRTILSGDFLCDTETFTELASLGCRYLSLDHHENTTIPQELTHQGNCLMMNVMFPWEAQRPYEEYQSGAGVVLDVLTHFDPSFNTPLRRALVGMTLLTDVRPLDYPNARPFLEELYSQPYEGYIRWLIDTIFSYQRDYSFGVPTIDRNFIDFKLSPFVNSLLRFNRGDLAINYIMGISRPDQDYTKLQKEMITQSQHFVRIKDTAYVRFLFVEMSKVPPLYQLIIGNFLGVLASRNMDTLPVLAMVVESDGHVTRASFRSPVDNLPYRDSIIKSTGVDCKGHSTAFGVLYRDVLTTSFLEKVSEGCALAVDNAQDSPIPNPITLLTTSLTDWLTNGGYEITKENEYVSRNSQVLLQYTSPTALVTDRPSYKRYVTECGSFIIGFGDASPETHYIRPVIDRKTVTFILDKEIK